MHTVHDTVTLLLASSVPLAGDVITTFRLGVMVAVLEALAVALALLTVTVTVYVPAAV